MPKTAVIIVAGGSGTRMGSDVPKQFLPLAGKPILLHTLKRFMDALPGAQIIVALPAGEIDAWNSICDKHGLADKYLVCAGGDTRFSSVSNALAVVDNDCELVAVHDGVRPLASAELIGRCVATAAEHGTAVPGIEPADSFRQLSLSAGSAPIDRSRLRAIQTPQVFLCKLLKKAYETAYDPRFTDDASVVEQAGYSITLCAGDPANIKITTPLDLVVAEALMANING